jgi:hypothetical protein
VNYFSQSFVLGAIDSFLPRENKCVCYHLRDTLCSASLGGDEGSDTWDDWQCDADVDSKCPSLLPPFEDIVSVATALQQAADVLSFDLKESAQLGGVRDIYSWISFVNWCRRSLEGGNCPKCGSKQDSNLATHMQSCADKAHMLRSPWSGDEQFLLPHRQEDGLLSQFSDDFSQALSDPAAHAPSQASGVWVCGCVRRLPFVSFHNLIFS